MLLRRKYPTDILTVFSISLVLFLAGIYGVLTIHSTHIINILKESLDIMIELEAGVQQEEMLSLVNELKNNEHLITGSVNLIERDEAKEMMIQELGDEYLIPGMENPFRNSILFRVKSEYYSSVYLSDLSYQLSSREIVSDVFYHQDFFQWLSANLRQFSYFTLGLGLVLLVLSITLIYNTVYLSLNADREKIQTMELVGASWKYIKQPYLKKAAIIGIISGILAITSILLFITIFMAKYSELKSMLNQQYLFVICLTIVLIGFFIPFVATYIIVTRYLKRIYI